MTSKKTGRGSKRTTHKSGSDSARKGSDASDAMSGAGNAPNLGEIGQFMAEMAAGLTQNALQLASRSAGMPGKLAGVFFLDADKRREFKPDALRTMADAGAYLKDARKVAGLTLDDLGTSLDLKDKSLLQAVESGTATLSFDLILRLASLLARHDPVPFVLKLARAYNPQAWQVLENWGVGRIPVQLGREREFINIYRRHDEAREMSDEEFTRVLEFTDKAFELALAFRRGDDPDEEADDDTG